MESANTNRRRVLVVNQSLQKRIILAIALFPTLGLTTAAILVAFFCRRLLGEAAQGEAELPSLVPLFLAVLGFVIVSGVVVLHQALRFSHRIAGPVYRISTSIQRVRDGDIGFRVHLRRHDYLVEIAEEFNLLLDWLNENPPLGMKTGSDVVEVHDQELLDEPALPGSPLEDAVETAER